MKIESKVQKIKRIIGRIFEIYLKVIIYGMIILSIMISGVIVVGGLFLLSEHLREFLFPTESFIACNSGVVDERVATLDVVVQRVQLAVRLGSTQPKRQLGNLDALFVDVNTIEIVFQDGVFNVGEHDALSCDFG